MKMSRSIDLGKSLRQVFGDDPESAAQVEQDRARQSSTVDAILKRFFAGETAKARELMILADEVGLGKTYVALATAVSILDAIRTGAAPGGLPANKPVVLVLTPTNDALFNKWMREAEAFKTDCARTRDALDWLDIRCPIPGSSRSGNVVDLAAQMREASRSRPMLLIAKHGVLGAALHDRDWWRRRALAIVFDTFSIRPADRKWWCRKILGTGAKTEVPELLDLRKSYGLWDGADFAARDLYRAFQRAVHDEGMHAFIHRLVSEWNADRLVDALDDLTRRALASDLPCLPLVIIDEVHNLKNEYVQARKHLESLLTGRVCRLLGLSATPFQLRQDELLSILKLRSVLDLPRARQEDLDLAIEKLSDAMKSSRDCGDLFRRRWRALRPRDEETIAKSWLAVVGSEATEQKALARQIRPPRVAHAIETALDLQDLNQQLQKHLRPFVIRHQHPRGYREHLVGKRADIGNGPGTLHFSWAPGMEVLGNDELAHYLMMRAVALAKEEKGLPGLGAELTGSYRHLVETAAVWKKLANAKNPLLRQYREVLEAMIADPNADRDHRKVQATVRRALEFFKRGQKTLVFCVFKKTAETIRDQIQDAVDGYINEVRDRVFGDAGSFENFRRRFFNRREPLFSLIQDHPLLGAVQDGRRGIPDDLRLTDADLHRVAELLVAREELAGNEKSDRRLLLAATEHVALRTWTASAAGEKWLLGEGGVLANCRDLCDRIADERWLEAREPLSRSERAGRVRRTVDPEAQGDADDPLAVEQLDDEVTATGGGRSQAREVNAWVRRLREDAIGTVIAPYFRMGLIEKVSTHLPILAEHHGELMAKLSLETRAVAGQVFRRVLMADEFLLRYLANVDRDNAERWADYLADRYVKPLDGHLETLRDRVDAYLETVVRAGTNKALLAGYHAAAENRNVVQLVKGETQNRDRYFLGFNTPYRPEILVATSVGQEGIDLHRECRHVIHHDLCWNPATIEQRTGRVDRIGSKVERERLGADAEDAPTLEIAVPYLAATYDERMFEELYRRAQLFEVTLGGDMRVEGRIELEQVDAEKRRREKAGIGTEDEDLGDEGDNTGAIGLPKDMVERLRVDLSVWKPRPPVSCGEASTTTTFPGEKIAELRQRASNAAQFPEDGPEGWSVSAADPMAVLAVFDSLRIKAGFILRAYQFRAGGNGNAFVWALPADALFPEPDDCPRLEDQFLSPPKPPAALDDLMDVIEGDGTPWSYLCASLFCREIHEFGAAWHGCDWSTHTILDCNPLSTRRASRETGHAMPSGEPEQWTWAEPEPAEWKPHVVEEADGVTVVFYTFSGLGTETIFRQTDRFTRGTYRFATDRKEIAIGPGGFVF